MTAAPRPRVMVVMTDLPFPARRNGISIRYAPIVTHLSVYCDVHLVVICDNPISEEERQATASHVTQLSVFVRTRRQYSIARRVGARLKSLLPSTTPHMCVAHDVREVAEFLRAAAGSVVYDVLLVVVTTWVDIARTSVRHRRLVVDAIDSYYLALTRLAEHGALHRYDTWKVRRWEKKIAANADYVGYVSAQDVAKVFGSTVDANRIGVIPNGLYLDDHTTDVAQLTGPVIGFLGNMAYPPNITAALKLFQIFRVVQQHVPGVKLAIIGRSPAPEILTLQAEDGVIVTGTVPSIWPYIHATTVFAFPLEHGAGQQNKLLEAMAGGIPVVTSPSANGGIGARHGEHVQIAESVDEFCQALIALLNNPEERARLGMNGKEFVESTFTWSASLALVDRYFIGRDQGRVRR